VEGMTLEVLAESLRRAGATLEGAPSPQEPGGLTKADLFDLGLSGGTGSGEKRKALQKYLNLPERLSANGLLQALNALYTRDELTAILESLEGDHNS